MDRMDLALLTQATARTDETTSALIEMIIGTVLMRHHETIAQGRERMEVDIAPGDMDDMHRRYSITREALQDGRTRFRIVERDEPLPSLRIQDEDVSDAKPQAQPKPEEPYWFVEGFFEGRIEATSRADAERQMLQPSLSELEPRLVNRACPHVDCPNPTHKSPPCVVCRDRA